MTQLLDCLQRMGGFKRVAVALELAYLPARRGRSAAGAWSPGDVQSPLALVQFGSSHHTVSISEVPESFPRIRASYKFNPPLLCSGDAVLGGPSKLQLKRVISSHAIQSSRLHWVDCGMYNLGTPAHILCRCPAHSPGGQQGSARAQGTGEGTPHGTARGGTASQISRRLRVPRHRSVARRAAAARRRAAAPGRPGGRRGHAAADRANHSTWRPQEIGSEGNTAGDWATRREQ